MSKERLEEIEKNLDPLGYGMGGHLISVNDIYWLVGYAKEQAERVQELEETNKKNYWIAADFKFENLQLEQQNKRYREALEEILAEAYEEAGVHPDTGMQLETYIVRIARKALEREG